MEQEKKVKKLDWKKNFKKHYKLTDNMEFIRASIVLVLAIAYFVIIENCKGAMANINLVSFFIHIAFRICVPVVAVIFAAWTIYLKCYAVDTSRWIVTPFMGFGVFAFLSFESFVVYSHPISSIDNAIISLLVAFVLYIVFMLYVKIFYK